VLSYRAHFPEIEVKVLARAEDPDTAQRMARAGADEVISRLDRTVVYAEGEQSLPEVVVGLLRAQGLQLAVAESCTGGWVAKLITDAAGASEVFRGGAVTYHNDAKQSWLGVEAALLERHGAVSAEVAKAMARGARERFDADIALALTGIAGPSGGTPDKPVGTVHYAVATTGGVQCRLLSYPATRAQVRLRAAYSGLALVREVLLATTENTSS
jgi:nicotinamide-nucleotide amidase